MDCVNHSGVNATVFCQNCGKPLCPACAKTAAGGQIFCDPCWMAWHGGQQPFVAPPAGTPNPVVAALLGLIPGVGAMYNGQMIKGLIHVLIFAVLVSAAHVYGIFGLFIAGWVCYQVFEAYHTAKARRDGDPLPDPLGLNELTGVFGIGRGMNQGMPPGGMPPGAPPASGAVPTGTGPAGAYQAPSQAQYQAPYETPFQTTYQGPNVPPGYAGPDFAAVPPAYWRRKEPIGAIVLIALGLLFLLGHFNWFSGRMFEFSWPVLLIGLGVWLIVKRLQDTQRIPQANSQDRPQDSSQGGQK
jgi:TM2 domain-containing membrane protein YozV